MTGPRVLVTISQLAVDIITTLPQVEGLRMQNITGDKTLQDREKIMIVTGGPCKQDDLTQSGEGWWWYTATPSPPV